MLNETKVKFAVDPWIFMHGTYIVDRGLIGLFFGLFSVASPLEIFLPTPLKVHILNTWLRVSAVTLNKAFEQHTKSTSEKGTTFV